MYLHSQAVYPTQRRSSLLFVLKTASNLPFLLSMSGGRQTNKQTKKNMSDNINIEENNWWEDSIHQLHLRSKQTERDVVRLHLFHLQQRYQDEFNNYTHQISLQGLTNKFSSCHMSNFLVWPDGELIWSLLLHTFSLYQF